jgi:hypothetical protein
MICSFHSILYQVVLYLVTHLQLEVTQGHFIAKFEHLQLVALMRHSSYL